MPLVTQAPAQAIISEQTKKSIERKRLVKIGVWTTGILAFLFLIATFVIGPYQVQGISMQPTFHTNDIVLVWELPQTWAKITGSQYVPARGNIVVVQKSPILGEQLIKRVIGLPGDRVAIANNMLTIFNSSHPAGFNPDRTLRDAHLIPPDDTLTTQVGDGQVFIMGDNRTTGASIDSRSSLGTIPSKAVVGKVVVRIYPFNKIKLF